MDEIILDETLETQYSTVFKETKQLIKEIESTYRLFNQTLKDR